MTPPTRAAAGRTLALALLLGLLGAAWYGQHHLQYGSPRPAGAWILGLALAAAVFVLLRADRYIHRSPALPDLRCGAEWLAVAGLVGLGSLFRFVHFGTIPEGMNHDAAWYGMYAIYITGGASHTPYTAAGFGRETLFMYLVAAFVHWLGNTPEALQLASSLCGVAALVPLYLLARAMFGGRVALIALAFLAVSGWHGVFSRVGWRLITVPPLEMVALYAAWRAVVAGRWRAWMLMGAGAAASVYTYNAARIVPVLTLLPYLLFFPAQPALRRRYLLGGVVALTAFLVVGFPMFWYASTHLDEFQRRVSAVSDQRQEEGKSLLGNAWDALRMFNYRGNGDDFFIDEPLLEPLAGVLLLVGVALALRNARQRPYAFLLLGLPLALLPGVWSVPNGNRAITAIPFVYLLIATGLDAVLTHAVAGFPRRRQAALYAAALTIAIAVAGFESYAEFLSAERRPMHGFSPGATGAALFMRSRLQQYAPYTVSAWADNIFLYLTYPGSGSPFEIGWPFGGTLEEIEADIDRRGDKGLMFVLDFSPAADAALAQLEQRFPIHRIEAIPAPRGAGAPVARALLVEAAAAAGPWRNFSRSLSVRREAGEPAAGALRCGRSLGASRGVSARVSLMLPELGEPMPLAHVGFWSRCPPEQGDSPLLTIAVNGSGLIAETDREATLVPWAKLEEGRWYEVYVAADASARTVRVLVEGAGPRVSASLPVAGRAALEVSGVELRIEAPRARGTAIYVDDLTVVGGALEPADPAWSAARGPRRRRRRRTAGGGTASRRRVAVRELRGAAIRAALCSPGLARCPRRRGGGGQVRGPHLRFDQPLPAAPPMRSPAGQGQGRPSSANRWALPSIDRGTSTSASGSATGCRSSRATVPT